MTMNSSEGSDAYAVRRIRIWYGFLVVIFALFFVRLFYLQIIRYGHYKNAALSDQLKQYDIPATRGTIMAYQGDTPIPIVLNQKLYTLYADPAYTKDASKESSDVAKVLGGDAADYAKKMQVKGS